MSMHDDEICAGVPCTIEVCAKGQAGAVVMINVPATVIDVERDEHGAVREILVRNESPDDTVKLRNGDVETVWYLPSESLFTAHYPTTPCGLCAPIDRGLWSGKPTPTWPPCKHCKGTKVIRDGKREAFVSMIELSMVKGKPPKPTKRAPLWFVFRLFIGERRSSMVDDVRFPSTVVEAPKPPPLSSGMRERPHLPFFPRR